MGEMTTRQALDAYRTIYLPSRNFKERTRTEYLNDLEDLVGFLESIGINRVGEISLLHLERYLAELDRRGYAGLTRRRKIITIRSFFFFLYQVGYTSYNVANRLIPPIIESKSPRFLTQSEYQRILAACASSLRDRALIELLLQTGMRLSELTRLTRQDIELFRQIDQAAPDTGYVRISGKSGRVLPLNSKACLALKPYLEARQVASSEILFLTRTGVPIGDRGIQKIVQRYLKKAGIQDASVESLRHTFGVQQALQGSSLQTLQKVMGHKDRQSTLIYITLTQGLAKKELQENAL